MSLSTEWEPSKTNICEVCSSEVEAQSFIQATRNTSSKPRSTDFPGTVHFPVESLHKVLFNSKELAKKVKAYKNQRFNGQKTHTKYTILLVSYFNMWLGRNGSSGQRWRLNGWQRMKAAISDPAWRLCIYWQCIVKADRCISTTTITKTSTILFIQTTIIKTKTMFINVLFIALPYSMLS